MLLVNAEHSLEALEALRDLRSKALQKAVLVALACDSCCNLTFHQIAQAQSRQADEAIQGV